ncbi:MAG TPA: ThiF family adenylyltransferase, partial [Thermoanaerobaculia bacterium]|nr:ThiF family adenylyltransferase [Thermoanaerobaculia bacterium]
MSAKQNSLTPSELERYGRHLVLPDFGEASQLALKRGSVAIIGAGGLGSPAAL